MHTLYILNIYYLHKYIHEYIDTLYSSKEKNTPGIKDS